MQENVCEYWLIILVCRLTLCVHLTGLRDVLSPFLTGQKAEEGQILSPSSELGCSSSLILGHHSSWFWGLQTQIVLYHQLSWFSSLQIADCGTSWAPWPRVNSYNRSLYVSLYILLVLCLWCTLTKIVFLPLYFYSSKQKLLHPQIYLQMALLCFSQCRWAVYHNGKLEILLDNIGGLPNSHLFSLFHLSRTLIFFENGIGLCSRKKNPFSSPGMSIDLVWSWQSWLFLMISRYSLE